MAELLGVRLIQSWILNWPIRSGLSLLAYRRCGLGLRRRAGAVASVAHSLVVSRGGFVGALERGLRRGWSAPASPRLPPPSPQPSPSGRGGRRGGRVATRPYGGLCVTGVEEGEAPCRALARLAARALSQISPRGGEAGRGGRPQGAPLREGWIPAFAGKKDRGGLRKGLQRWKGPEGRATRDSPLRGPLHDRGRGGRSALSGARAPSGARPLSNLPQRGRGRRQSRLPSLARVRVGLQRPSIGEGWGGRR